MTQISKKRQPFLNTESWDDFLDFSRMRKPTKEVLGKRLVENSIRFSGNYIWIWRVLTLAWGMFLDLRILASLFTIVLGWFAAQVLYHRQNSTGNQENNISFYLVPKVSDYDLFLFHDYDLSASYFCRRL